LNRDARNHGFKIHVVLLRGTFDASTKHI
jgi:hypothetical protein